MQERLPRSTGELLSDAMSLMKRHFSTVYLLALPFCAVDLVLREAGQSAFGVLRARLGDNPTDIDLSAVAGAAATGAGGFGMLMGSAIVMTLLSSGLVALANEAWFGRPLQLKDAFASMTARGAALILTSFLFLFALGLTFVVPVLAVAGLAAFGSLVAAAVVGILAAFAVVLLVVALSLRWGIYTPVVVLESRWGPSAFSRSTALMAGRGLPLFEGAKFRLSLLFLITFALSGTLQSLFALPRLGVAAAGGWSVADGMPPLASLPLWFIVPFGLLEVATNALLVPFSSVLITLFYFDLRVRYEALDLDSPGGPASAMTTP